MAAEGELRSHIDDSEKVRELQEKMGEMKAEVSGKSLFFSSLVIQKKESCCFWCGAYDASPF